MIIHQKKTSARKILGILNHEGNFLKGRQSDTYLKLFVNIVKNHKLNDVVKDFCFLNIPIEYYLYLRKFQSSLP